MYLLLVLFLNFYASEALLLYPDYEDHPCKRKCDGKPMLCQYNLTVEWMYTMEPNCLDCLNGKRSDCDRKQCIVADGQPKLIYTFNRMFPGPKIEVCKDDTIVARVRNLLNDVSTSIHWHGILQKCSQWMDGVPMVTQCPILPDTYFDYKFNVPLKGTYFYHSHSALQLAFGLAGALVVREGTDPQSHLYDFDLSEHIILVSEFVPGNPNDLFYRYFALQREPETGVSAMVLNGMGGKFNNSVPYRIFNVQKGKKYRFRLIDGGSMLCPIKFSIQNHKMKIISTDGEDIQPVEVDSVLMLTGERYDFVLNANQPIGKYWIQITGYEDCSGVFSNAMLQYENAGDNLLNATTTSAGITMTDEIQMNCIYGTFPLNNCINASNLRMSGESKTKLSGEPAALHYFAYDDYKFAKKIYEGVNDTHQMTPAINNITFSPPDTVLLAGGKHQEFCFDEHKLNCQESINKCDCLHVVTVPQNKLVEFILVDEGKFGTRPHPFHLHGYKFYVVGMKFTGPTTIDEIKYLNQQGLLQRNFNNPPQKDTIAVPNGGYVIIRFIADNPGFWLLHCHVDIHMVLGMGLVVQVGKPPKLPSDFPKCGNYDARKKMTKQCVAP